MAKVLLDCPACHAMVEASGRFCPRCRVFLPNVSVGRSASPIRRLGATVLDWGVLIAATEGDDRERAGPVDGRRWGGAGPPGVLGVVAHTLVGRRESGKRLFRIQVIDDSGNPPSFFTMVIREWFGKVLSAAIFGLGFIWALFDDNHQAWHDKILGTYVIETDPVEIQAGPRSPAHRRCRRPPRPWAGCTDESSAPFARASHTSPRTCGRR